MIYDELCLMIYIYILHIYNIYYIIYIIYIHIGLVGYLVFVNTLPRDGLWSYIMYLCAFNRSLEPRQHSGYSMYINVVSYAFWWSKTAIAFS